MSAGYDPLIAARDRASSVDRVAAAYEEHYPLLAYLASRRFGIPDNDVQAVIHDAFVSYLRHEERVNDVRAWLIGATCNRCRLYWRQRGRERRALSMATSADVATPSVIASVDLARALRRLDERCREVLRLRFACGYSSSALAEHFATTVAYARKLVYRCALRAREHLRKGRP